MTAIATPNAFPRGTTAGEYTASSIGATDLASFLGIERFFPDTNLGATGTIKPLRSNRWVRCRSMRNSVGQTVYNGDMVVPSGYKSQNVAGSAGTAGVEGTIAFDGKSRLGVAADAIPSKCYPVDEWLGSAGCPSNDICWVVIEGPAKCRLAMTSLTADIVPGDFVCAITSTTANATTSATTAGDGRINRFNAAVTTHGIGAIRNVIGRALSAATTNQSSTNGLLLVDVGSW